MSASSSNDRPGVVLLVDVAGSSEVAEFAASRDERIHRLSERHRAKRWIAASYTVTAWDEFQTVLWEHEPLPYVLLDIRQALAPWGAYIGVGFGAVSGWRSRQPINQALGGKAFERARAAIDALKGGRGDKYPRLTHFRSENPKRDALLNLIYSLHDSLVRQVTERQWHTIGLALDLASQEEVALRLGVQPSTVTRNLKRGHYWQMRDTAAFVAELLAGKVLAPPQS